MSDIILETRQLTKEFKGFTAVSRVDLKVERGAIHALIGPNGAGKTTCFNLLTKFLEPSAGRIFFNDRDITRVTPARIARLGVIRSFQISAVFPHMTALQNVRVGLQRRLGTSFHFWKPARSLDRLNARAMELLAQVRAEVAVLPAPEFSRTPNTFTHIFSGGYAAGYYSYKWAEVLSADAYAAFEETAGANGEPSVETGRRYRTAILEAGGSRPAMESFKAFRGREPQLDALLRHQGMAPVAAA